MKTNLKLLLMIVLSISVFSLNARDLRDMPERKRNEILIKEAKRVILKHGPDYYREFAPPIIEFITEGDIRSIKGTYENRLKWGESAESLRWLKETLDGRRWYRVSIPYDITKESFNINFAAMVYIWTDTHEAFSVCFGNAMAIDNIDVPLKKGEKVKVVKYQKRPPMEMKTIQRNEPEYL